VLALAAEESKMSEKLKSKKPVVQPRIVRPHAFIAPRGYAEPDGEYRSCFNFVWWFWLPRIHTQRPDAMNPRVIRLIWLCFAVGLDIWGKESQMYWPKADYATTSQHITQNLTSESK
jgi:hypothetical protein